MSQASVRATTAIPVEARRRARVGIAAALLIAAGACLEPPVTERVEIEFADDGATTVRTEVRLRRGDDLEGRARDRVARVAREVAEESDDWSRRLRAMDPEEDRYQIDRVHGEVASARRAAGLAEREQVERLFAGTQVAARYAEGTSWQELSLVPDRSGPAPMSERRKTDAEIQGWAEQAAKYYGAAEDLWSYVASHPERARPCFEALFLDDEPADATDEETTLVKRLKDGIGQVVGMLATDPTDEYTLSERVRRSYDPFPAAIKVRIPVAPLEVEGFAVAADGALAIEPLDLWNAFRSLEGKWIAPDPAVAIWKHETTAPVRRFDLDAFLAQPRAVKKAPGASDIVAELRRALEPAAVYRVRWRRAGEGEGRLDEGR